MKKFIYILFFIFSLSSLGQEYSLMEKFVLPSEVEETSGLIFLNGKIITHNDSGDDPNLYEIDTISGTISRIINITNATHIDWEDISQDNTYIYIADIGNNNGDRDNLIIYKIFFVIILMIFFCNIEFFKLNNLSGYFFISLFF